VELRLDSAQVGEGHLHRDEAGTMADYCAEDIGSWKVSGGGPLVVLAVPGGPHIARGILEHDP
jgi:hypothetical protein